MKFLRLLIVLILILAVSARVSPSLATAWRSAIFTPLAPLLGWTRAAGDWLVDLRDFRQNAAEARQLRSRVSQADAIPMQNEELRLENLRLTRLLEIKQTLPNSVLKTRAARVIARSPSVWNRIVFIDQGSMKGVRPGMAVLSGASLIGRVSDVGPGSSKVMLVTDPLFRAGALVQRTRDQGVLFGTPSGECRMKYLPVTSDLREGDLVETAGAGSIFPKAIPVGVIDKIWKEPGQVYRVARIRPAADISRMEEVLCVE